MLTIPFAQLVRVFFKTTPTFFFQKKKPHTPPACYRQHLGIESENWGGFAFHWREDPQKDGGVTAWSIFPDSTKYFAPSTQPFMINFRVADLQELVTALRAEGEIGRAS